MVHDHGNALENSIHMNNTFHDQMGMSIQLFDGQGQSFNLFGLFLLNYESIFSKILIYFY